MYQCTDVSDALGKHIMSIKDMVCNESISEKKNSTTFQQIDCLKQHSFFVYSTDDQQMTNNILIFLLLKIRENKVSIA